MKCNVTISVAALLVVLAAGCAKPDLASRFTPAWEPFDPSTEGWLHTSKTLLVSDCQLHNLLSKPLPERNVSLKAAITTSIRAPQLDMFAGDVLRWILATTGPECEGIVHLGDGCDLACEAEFDKFLAVMETTDKPWVMAPGNHDFFYFGSYDTEDIGLWEEACYEGGRVLTKDLFIRLYVAAILRQQDPGFAALATALGVGDHRDEPPARLAERLPDEFEWKAEHDDPGYVRRIAWKIDRKMPWRSFIVQSVRQSATERDWQYDIFVLDSCQYTRRPGLIPNAWGSYPLVLNCGSTGEMLPDQLRLVRRWLEEGRAHGHVLAYHHPYGELAPRTKASLGWLWRERRVGMMVTAHTHVGYYQYHDLGDGETELELNVASTTDWPMEWRTLQGFVNPQKQEIYVQSERHTLVDELRERGGYFDVGWEIPINAPDDYRKYKQGEPANIMFVDFYLAHHLVPYWLPAPHVRASPQARETEEQIKDTMLWTYFRLLQYFPTDPTMTGLTWPPGTHDDRTLTDRILAITGERDALEKKVALLKELEQFERNRRSADPRTGASTDDVRLRYKLSQAAWASRFEYEKGRRLRVEDDLIRVDWERSQKKTERAMENVAPEQTEEEDAEKKDQEDGTAS